MIIIHTENGCFSYNRYFASNQHVIKINKMLSNIPKELINNDSRDCPICFKETDGLRMTYH